MSVGHKMFAQLFLNLNQIFYNFLRNVLHSVLVFEFSGDECAIGCSEVFVIRAQDLLLFGRS